MPADTMDMWSDLEYEGFVDEQYDNVETASQTYATGVPASESVEDDIPLEANVKRVLLRLSVTASTATPVYDATIPTPLRLLAFISRIKLTYEGEENILDVRGIDLFYLHVLFNGFTPRIDALPTGVAGSATYVAEINLPLGLIKEKGRLYYSIDFEGGTGPAASDTNPTVTAASLVFAFGYGIPKVFMYVFRKDQTINGKEDILLSEATGPIHGFVLDAFDNTNTVESLTDIELKNKRIGILTITSSIMHMLTQKSTFDQMSRTDYLDVQAFRFKKPLPVDKSTILKLTTSESIAIRMTFIHLIAASQAVDQTAPEDSSDTAPIVDLPASDKQGIAPPIRSKDAGGKLSQRDRLGGVR